MSALATVRRAAKHALPLGETVRTLPFGIGRGLKMGVDLHGGQVGMYLGLYEIELNRHLRRLCPRGTASFDIGGQRGYDALVLAKLTRAPVVSVECETEWCDAIRSNIEANPSLAPLVSVQQGFIAEADDATTGRMTLDTLADRTFAPHFLKIDIEGGEAAALRGAERVLAEKPGLLIEVHSAALELECLDILRGQGYLTFVVDQRTWLPDHRPLEHNRWIVSD